MVTAETNPEVAVGGLELSDELLDELLFRQRLHAQQLPAVPSAGQLGLGEVQPPPRIGEIGQFVTRPAFSCPAHSLTCRFGFTDEASHRARSSFLYSPKSVPKKGGVSG